MLARLHPSRQAKDDKSYEKLDVFFLVDVLFVDDNAYERLDVFFLVGVLFVDGLCATIA